MRRFIPAVALVTVTGSLLAQDLPELAQNSEPVQQNDLQSAIQNFLSKKEAAQSIREARISERGKASDAREIRQMMRALGIESPKPTTTVSAAQSDALRESLLTEATQLLAFSELSPGRIKQLQAEGINPLDVAVRYIQGTGTLTDQAILADRTVVAELISLKDENLNDGFGSTATFRVTQNLVASGAPNLAVRQRSGIEVGGDTITYSADFKPDDVGSRFLITTSSGLYDEGSAMQRAQPSGTRGGTAKYQVLLGTHYLVRGDTAVPVYGSGQPTTVTAIAQQLDTLERAKGRLIGQAVN